MLRRSFLKFPPTRAVLLVGVLVVGGCASGTEVCPAILSSSLGIRVTDARTGAALGSGTTVQWRSGAFQGTADLIVVPDAPDAPRFFVYGPAGRYDILVERQGYAPLLQSGIVVPSNGCGPESVSLAVKLAPLT